MTISKESCGKLQKINSKKRDEEIKNKIFNLLEQRNKTQELIKFIKSWINPANLLEKNLDHSR